MLTRISFALKRVDAALGDALRPVMDRLKQATPRERLLLGLLVLGAAVYAPIAAMESRTVQSERYLDAVAERANARLAAQQARRVIDGAADSTALEDMNSWGFEAENAAVAQVLIEQKLVEAAAEAELVNPRITTNTDVTAIGPTSWLSAEVQTDLRWDPAFAFLDLVAAWPEGFRVTGFRYEIAPFRGRLEPGQVVAETGRIRIGLAFPVRIATPAT